MANIGEPQRVIIAEPVFEPVPEKAPRVDERPFIAEPEPEPEEVPVGDE